MLNAGAMICDQYKIEKQIGQGGMSIVYLARDEKHDRPCAIKVVKRSSTDQNNTVVTQSLAAEAGMLKQLSNIYLPEIYDIIEQPHSITMVMEYVQGESLDRVLMGTGPRSIEEVIGWGMQLCNVFEYLHNQPSPIIYRDLKPANVMLQPNGSIKLIDFGTARFQKVGVTMSSDTIMIGTEGFAAPEQYGGMGQSDARTDIYCLGGTMYNLLTGMNPTRSILVSIATNEYLHDTPMGDVLTKCLQNDPDRRYQTAGELSQALQQVLETGNRRNSGLLKRGRGAAPGGSWQVGNALSGLLKGNNTGMLKNNSGGLKKSEELKDTKGWITPSETGLTPDGVPVQANRASGRLPAQAEETAEETSVAGDDELWRMLLMVAAIAALFFITFAVVCTLGRNISVAAVAMCFAAVAAVGAVFCTLKLYG